MKTAREQLRELREKQAKEYQELKNKLCLQKNIKDASYYYGCEKLYGATGGVSFELENDKDSINKAIKILNKYKPIKMQYTKGSWTRYLPKDIITEEYKQKENITSNEDMFPIEIEIENSVFNQTKLSYYTYIQDKKVSIDIKIRNFTGFGYSTGDRNEYRGGFNYTNCKLVLDSRMSNDWKSIKRGRGSDQYINDFTIHNLNMNYTLEDFIKLLKESI